MFCLYLSMLLFSSSFPELLRPNTDARSRHCPPIYTPDRFVLFRFKQYSVYWRHTPFSAKKGASSAAASTHPCPALASLLCSALSPRRRRRNTAKHGRASKNAYGAPHSLTHLISILLLILLPLLLRCLPIDFCVCEYAEHVIQMLRVLIRKLDAIHLHRSTQ